MTDAKATGVPAEGGAAKKPKMNLNRLEMPKQEPYWGRLVVIR